MVQFEAIIPVSLFKRDTKEYLIKLEMQRNPILLTVHGRGAFVLEHVNSYMRIAELAEAGAHERAVAAMLQERDYRP